jgi:phosphoribosyl 1,2-cyclic phosphodiesterase
MRIISLGSGSSGNGFLVDTGSIACLIDCGVGVRTVQAAIRDAHAADRLAAIVLSHEHIDHVRAVESIARRFGCPVVTTRGTEGQLRSSLRFDRRSAGQRFVDGALEVGFVGVSHDAAEPSGFVVEHAGDRVAIFTDLGYVTDEVYDALSDIDIIVLEANYDPLMLARGPYPRMLKRRVSGPAGHLSNDDCAAALVGAVAARTRGIWLAHLSDTNNTPDIARLAVEEALALAGHAVPVGTLPRYERADVMDVPAWQLAFGL